jgi:ankyrin repeat protein
LRCSGSWVTESNEKVVKRDQTGGIFVLLAVLVCMSIMNPELRAQPGELLTLSDTSYFRAGEDDWNLVESVLRSEPASVLMLLNRGASPDAGAEGGMTALMYAAERGDTLILKLLVLNGADVELTHVENTTPLMVAVLNRQFDAAHLLLRKGANPDHRDDYMGIPLIYAAAMNDYQMADLLLFYGATDSLKDGDSNDALMTAVFFGNLETADVLLQNGLMPDSRDNNRATPLMIAAERGDSDMVSLLLEYGAEKELTDRHNFTPLAHAILAGEEKTARILVDSGANVHHRISKNQNLCDLAAGLQEKEIRKMLKEKGAAPTPRPDFSVFGAGWGNSFGRNEHMMQVRVWVQDRRFGFFAETGYDVRPTRRTVQVSVNDSLIHQYRERRSAWIHGIGKYFSLVSDGSGLRFGPYAGLYGMLSFPSYNGIGDRPPVEYNLIPAAGLFFTGKMAGIKTGIERYTFGTIDEGRWKMNITLYLLIQSRPTSYEPKEISY